MYEDEESQRDRRAEQATLRGERLRSELVQRLKKDGPRSAVELLPQVDTPNVSLSEVAFQLDRLAGEGRTVGEQGGPYRLA